MRKPTNLVLIIICIGLATGCRALPGGTAPTMDPLAVYRPALLPEYSDVLDEAGPLPEYRIDAGVDPVGLQLRGKMELTLPPAPDGSVPAELYFRLYPNLPHYGGSLTIDLVTVNGQGAPFIYVASDTAVDVSVPPSVAVAGEPLVVGMQWNLEANSFGSERYTLFGQAEGVISLPLFYPSLAVRDDQVSGDWHLELGEPHGDAAFSETSLFQVGVTVPEGYVVVATGSLVDIQDAAAVPEEDPAVRRSWKTWRFVSGPAREFALFVSDQYRLAEITADGVKINSWYLAGDDATGRAAAEYTAAALRVYSALFGAYPHAELDVVAGPVTFRGMEYPGLFELGVQLYRDGARELESRIAHEVAHQWWYNLVGNDPVNEPWLDEGLAEYSTYFYRQRTAGQSVADLLAEDHWRLAYQFAQDAGLDAVVAQPLDAFQGNYEVIVYGKAALFHHALRDLLGDEQYLALLRRYAEDYRFKIATAEDFISLAEEYAGPEARALYRQWILEVQAPAPAEPDGEG